MNRFITLTAAAVILIGCLLSPAGALARVDREEKATFSIETPPIDVAASVDGKWFFVLTENNTLQIYSADGALNDTLTVAPGTDRIAVSGFKPGRIEDKVYLINTKSKTVTELALEFSVDIDITGSPYMGPAGAPVTIVVFSDFE